MGQECALDIVDVPVLFEESMLFFPKIVGEGVEVCSVRLQSRVEVEASLTWYATEIRVWNCVVSVRINPGLRNGNRDR